MFKILDCTLRDGGYINNWRFNKKFIDKYIELMEKNNIDYVEIGFINKTNNYKEELVGDIRNLNEDIINKFQNKNFKIAVMIDFDDIDFDFLEKKIKIDLIRVAFHKNDLNRALETCKCIKDLGYKVSVNAMAITNYNNDELDYLLDTVNKYKLDILYIADSYGSLNQYSINEIITLFKKKLDNTIIGIHLHNNMNNAFSNFESLTNLKDELFIDTTLFGMGRGAGNLQTELVLLNLYNIDFNNLLELLSFIQDYIKPIYAVEENNWGYDLDYLLSGYLKMHSNYIAKMRDSKISMKNRFFLINLLKNNYNYKLFDKNIINKLIIENKDILI